MGNQLVAGVHVPVESISPGLIPVSTLGVEGKNHFSTIRCHQIRKEDHTTTSAGTAANNAIPVSNSHEEEQDVPQNERANEVHLPLPPYPEWYAVQRHRLHHLHLLKRVLASLEVLDTKYCHRSISAYNDSNTNNRHSDMRSNKSNTTVTELGSHPFSIPRDQSGEDVDHLLHLAQEMIIAIRDSALVKDATRNTSEDANNTFATRLSMADSVSLSRCEEAISFLQRNITSLFSHRMENCSTDPNGTRGSTPLNGATSSHDDVVIKVFSHPEPRLSGTFRHLWKRIGLIANQLHIVDGVRFAQTSDGTKRISPCSILFYTLPYYEEVVHPSNLDSSSLVESSVTGQGGSSFQEDSSLPLVPKYIHLKRPFVAYSLPERVTSRPYWNRCQRLFTAFQLLKAVQSLHEVYGVTHGDIKPANVLIQHSGWLLLTDLAPYKPALLPMDPVTLFEYFYEAEDNRFCYCAPEKFVSSVPFRVDEGFPYEGGLGGSFRKNGPSPGFSSPARPQHHTSPSLSSLPSLSSQSSSIPSSQHASMGYSLANINMDGHTATMDMFSVGCVLVYLFSEEHPFSLADVLELRSRYNNGLPDKKRHMETERVHFVRKMLKDKNVFGRTTAVVAHRGYTMDNKVYGTAGGDGAENNSEKNKHNDSCHEGNQEVDRTEQSNDEVGSEDLEEVALTEMITLLLASSPEDRPSSTDILEAFSPSIFPPFFDYLYEEIFPMLLSQDPDRQLLFFSENIRDILESAKRQGPNDTITIDEKGGAEEGKTICYHVVSILLPAFLIALRSASQHRCIYEGLRTLQDTLWHYLPIVVRIENVLPHLLYFMQHPEEHDGLTRLTAWRLITSTGYAFTAHLLNDNQTYVPRKDRVCNTEIERTLIDAYTSSIPLSIRRDPYVSPFVGMEHGMLFDSVILPLLPFAFQGPSSSALIQEEIVLLEMTRTIPTLFFLSELCLEWQHNDYYAKSAERMEKWNTSKNMVEIAHHNMDQSNDGRRQKKEMQSHCAAPIERGLENLLKTGEKRQETLLSFWQTFFSRRRELHHLSWTIFCRLMTHEMDEVVSETFIQLPQWIHWFGEDKTRNNVFPLLMESIPRLLSPSGTPSSTRLVFFEQCILAHGLPEVTGHLGIGCGVQSEGVVENAIRSYSNERNPSPLFHEVSYYNTLSSFLVAGLKNKHDCHLLCVVLDSLKRLMKMVKMGMSKSNGREKNDGKGRLCRTSSDRSGFFREDDARYLLKLVLLAVPLLTHYNRKVGFSAAGVIVQAAKLLPVVLCLMPLCHVVRPLLAKPVPLLFLQSPGAFPHCLRPEVMEAEWTLSTVFNSPLDAVRGKTVQQRTSEERFKAIFQELNQWCEVRNSTTGKMKVKGIIPRVIHMPLMYPWLPQDRADSKLFRLRFPLSPKVPVRRPLLHASPAISDDAQVHQTTAEVSSTPPVSAKCVTITDGLLYTLNPSGVPVLSHRVERSAAIYGLTGIGNRLIFAAGSKGVAVLMRWKVRGMMDDDEEGVLENRRSNPHHPQGTMGMSRNEFLSCALLRNKQKQLLYRSEHSLEVVQRYPWWGGVISGGNNETLSTVEQSFVEMHRTYTAVQCMNDHPADPLSSVHDRSNCFVALGSSLGYISVVDVERGAVVYASAAENIEDASCLTNGCSVTSLLSVQSNVLLSTCSSGLVSLFDIRAPSHNTDMQRVWSSRLRLRDLGMPTSSCGLYYAPTDKAYATLIGTSGGACQLIDLRFQLPVQNYWLRWNDVLSQSENILETEASSSFEAVKIAVERQDAWSSGPSSTMERSPPFPRSTYAFGSSITQICCDPLSSSLSATAHGSQLSSPWLLLSTSCGHVYRMHLATGTIHEALRAPSRSLSEGASDGSGMPVPTRWKQRLWVPQVSCMDAAPSSLPRKDSGRMRVFSGGGDGRIRQWDLNDILCCSSPMHQRSRANSSTGLHNDGYYNYVPSPNSTTFQTFPFASPPYYVRMRRRVESSVNHKEDLLSSALVEDENSYVDDTHSENGIARQTVEEAEMDKCIPPPAHEDEVTSLGVAVGNEYADPGLSLCLMSASRDGMIHVWRNR